MMKSYTDVWERFVSERRIEFGGHKDPSWQDGHTLSASLMVPVDVSRMRDRLEPLRNALRPFPFVSLHPDHFMHITLFLPGFLVPDPEKEGEVAPERITDIEIRARRALAGFPAFTVELANLNAFPGAAFIEVHDDGTMEELRRSLRENCGLRKPRGLPHLTLAYFQAPDGTRAPRELIEAVREYRDWPIGEVSVSSVRLTLLDLRKDYPEPQSLADIPLGTSHPTTAAG